ncbi:MAG: hypothetical protein GXY73_08150 [Methanothrix sp.]|jgi:hypothetical protein|nr:hypothetical protein [Methanothrix sp.]
MAKLGGMRRRKKTIGREEMVEGIRGIRRKMKGSEGGWDEREDEDGGY